MVMLKAVALEVQHLRHHTMKGGGTSLKLPSQLLNMKTSSSSRKGNNIPGERSVTSSHICYKILSKITSFQQKITRHKEIGKNREFPGGPVVRCFHYQGLDSIPGQETYIPNAKPVCCN